MHVQGRDKMYDHFGACGVDPRNLAQRIMEVGFYLIYWLILTFISGCAAVSCPALLAHDLITVLSHVTVICPYSESDFQSGYSAESSYCALPHKRV